MTVVGEMWEKHLNRTRRVDAKNSHHMEHHPTIIFTTETVSMVNEQKAFVAENQVTSRYPHFKFNFVTNPHDVTPNSSFKMSDNRRTYRY